MTRTTYSIDPSGYLSGCPVTLARPWWAVILPDDKRPERRMLHFAEQDGKRRPHAALWKVGTALEIGSKGQARRWYGIVVDIAPGCVVLEERPSWQAALGVTVALPERAPASDLDGLLLEQATLITRLAEIARQLVELARVGLEVQSNGDFDTGSMEVAR